MNKLLIKILKDDFSFLTSIRAYISFYFIRNFTAAGEFQMVLNIKYAGYFKKDYFIYLSKKKSFIIESVVEDEKRKTVTVKGQDIKSIISRRITIPPAGSAYDALTANGETIMKHLVNVNCVNPIDPTRIIPELTIATDQNRGLHIHWDSRYKNLATEAESISCVTGLGWTIELDQTNKKLIFDVVEGVDRSYEQSANNRVIFSKKLKNMKNPVRSIDTADYKNYAYVAGQGEGAAREIVSVTNGDDIAGLKRREVIVDARDLSTTDGLYTRGNTKLSETVIVENTEMEITNNNFIYEDDWDLGDTVTIQSGDGYMTQKITEVREVYETITSIEITTGNPAKTLSDKMKLITDEQTGVTVLTNIESIDGGTFV